MSRDPRPENAVGLRLELAPADRDRLLVAAAKAGKSMASYLREVVVGHLDRLDAKEARKGRREGMQ